MSNRETFLFGAAFLVAGSAIAADHISTTQAAVHARETQSSSGVTPSAATAADLDTSPCSAFAPIVTKPSVAPAPTALAPPATAAELDASPCSAYVSPNAPKPAARAKPATPPPATAADLDTSPCSAFTP